jgi:hypothetical protein
VVKVTTVKYAASTQVQLRQSGGGSGVAAAASSA